MTSDRLKESLERFEREEREAGESAGTQFASDECEYADLRRLADWYSGFHHDTLDEVFSDERKSEYTVAEKCFYALFPEQTGERGSAALFWEAFTDRPTATFVRGFVLGCAEVMSEI